MYRVKCDAAAAARDGVGAVAPNSVWGAAGTVTGAMAVTSGGGNDSVAAILPLLHPHWVGMEQLDIFLIECQKFLINLGIFTASVFLSSDVGDLAEKYQVWRKKTAEQDPSASR
jgi:hypothetical protein